MTLPYPGSVLPGVNSSATLWLETGIDSGQNGVVMESLGDDLAPVRWRFANAEYNERQHELTVSGEAVPLEPKPLEVLLCLLRAEGELVTKQELFATVWADKVVTDGVLTQAIRRIREVLGDHERTMLRTVHGYGFRLDVPIEIEGRDDPGTRLQLSAGQTLRNMPGWVLDHRLQTRPANELWQIRNEKTHELRVVKLALDERARRGLQREVTLNKVLRSELGTRAPLAPLLDWQFETSPAWIQMPWYENGSLADWLQAQGGPEKIPLLRRLNIVAEAAEALAGAHALGVMHKDLKPGNLLVEQAGTEPRLLLCDFGSGTIKSRERLEEAGVTVMGFTKTVQADSSTSGTPAYMAPEVLKGGVFSEQSDVYALGVLLYQLVIGDLNEPLAPGWEEDVDDAGLRAIIADACAGKPARRTPSMQALAQRLRSWEARPWAQTRSAEPATRPNRREWRAVGAKIMLGVVLVLLTVWVAHKRLPDLRPAPPPAASTSAAPRVAILAFDLLGLDKQTQTVMGGLQDALLADLANLADIRLVPGHNLKAMGLADAPAPRIGLALNVDQLIRGSVQQLGDQLRVNLQIVDAGRGETIWGQAIEGTRSDLFSVQASIARTLAAALGSELNPDETQAVDSAAYEAYLEALSFWKQGHDKHEDFAAGIQRALALDPDFIDAHLLALMKAARDYWFSGITRTEAETRIAGHLSALEQQNTPPFKLATARAVRRYYLDHDPGGGVDILAPFRRQLMSSTDSALFYAYMLRRVGRSEEAFELLDQVMDRDPSARVPIETKAELLAFQGRGGEAIELLQEIARRFDKPAHSVIKMASFAYQLTGDLSFVRLGHQALARDETYRKRAHIAELEIARRTGDMPGIRRLALQFEDEDKTFSGHGRLPRELGVALALRSGQAPREEVQEMAQRALEKMQRWRAESDSAARRSTMALILALLDRGEDAIALSQRVEAEFPLRRDQLEAADRRMETATMYAVLGDEKAVLERLKTLAGSRFVSMNLCAIPQSLERQPIWQLPRAQRYIIEQCKASWTRNQAELLPLLDQLREAI